jgi:hypothetical protein
MILTGPLNGSKKNSLELIELSSIHKVSVVRFPPVVMALRRTV